MKKLLVLSLCLFVLSYFTIVAVAQEKEVIKLAYIYPSGSTMDLAAKQFKKLVEEKTKGNIEIQLFPGGQLGGEIDNRDAMKMETLDAAIVGIPLLAAYVEEMPISDLWYFWKSQDHYVKFWESELGQEWIKRYEDATGIRVLAINWITGYREMISKKPIHNTNDAKGIKIRVAAGFPHQALCMEAANFTTVPLAFPEVYSALQQGVIDAAESPIDEMYKAGFHESTKYLILSHHLFNSRTVQFSAKTFNQLSSEQQKICIEAAKEAGVYQNKLVDKVTLEAQKKMEEAGLEIINPDIESFRENVVNAHPQWVARFEGGQEIYDYIQGLAE